MDERPSGKLADPQWRAERARKAARTRTSLDHHLAKVLEAAPDLSADQLDKLRQVVANHGEAA